MSDNVLSASTSLHGGIESHLSSSGSQRRLRSINSSSRLASEARDVESTSDAPHQPSPSDSVRDQHPHFPGSGLFVKVPLYGQQNEHGSVAPRYSLWMVVLLRVVFMYACWCAVFMPASLLFRFLYRRPSLPFEISPLESLSVAQRLSRISPGIYPPPLAFLPALSRVYASDPSTPTACVWIPVEELSSVTRWQDNWLGPMSVLVTTTASASSYSYERSLQRMKHISRSHHTIVLHLLHLHPTAQAAPNAFLNLARLFAPTPRVVLFPSNLSVFPDSSLYATSLAYAHAYQKPAVFVPGAKKAFPIPSSTPLLIPKDFPTWCTERFFFDNNRGPDWELCLWQVWLDSFGDVSALDSVPHVGYPPYTNASLTTPIQRRLSMKYRSEACYLANRQLAALENATEPKTHAKRTKWLKKFCHEHLANWAQDLL